MTGSVVQDELARLFRRSQKIETRSRLLPPETCSSYRMDPSPPLGFVELIAERYSALGALCELVMPENAIAEGLSPW
jgi:hypothetical protein